MSKYCPIMSCQDKWHTTQECLGKECAWADKNGNCLIAKALKQITDPISVLVPGYPTDQNILQNRPTYNTDMVTPIDYPYRPIKLKMQGEIEADDN